MLTSPFTHCVNFTWFVGGLLFLGGHFCTSCYIVYNENKRRTKIKEMEREKNEFIKNTSYCNHRV